MKFYLKFAALLILSFQFMSAGVFCQTKMNAGTQSLPEVVAVFSPDSGNYATTRIPALVMTKKGSLLAFCEGRINGMGDWAAIDILLRRSTDGGKTWGKVRTLVAHDTLRPTTSNSTPIVDRNGTIHFLFQRNYADAYYIRSEDDGLTWSEPVSITYAFNAFKKDHSWKVLAPGPGHAIQLRTGRLLVPVWLCEPDKSRPGGDHRPSFISTVYSDDLGKTWNRGDIIADNGNVLPNSKDTIVNPSENVAVELADGRVMLNIRTESTPHSRLVSYSKDGATHWSQPAFEKQLFDPVCMASLIRVSGNDKPGPSRILFVNPDSHENPAMLSAKTNFRRRENLTAKLSYDEGKTWKVQNVLYPGEAGYSDLAVGVNGTLYCLYEVKYNSDNFWKQRIVLQPFSLEWLSGGKDSWQRK